MSTATTKAICEVADCIDNRRGKNDKIANENVNNMEQWNDDSIKNVESVAKGEVYKMVLK